MCLCFSVQGHDNPFQADGELSHKADFILRHSTISRTEIHIVDPDSPTPVVEEVTEDVVAQTESSVQSAPPPEIKSKENGQVDDSVNAKDVKVDVGKGDNGVEPAADPAAKSKAPKKKCECCVVM